MTSQGARLRLAKVGPNELAPTPHRSSLRSLTLLFTNPLVAILLVAGLASAVVGDYINAALIIIIVLLSVALNYVQTARSARAVEKLRQEVTPTATALRDGAWTELPRGELVPGDIVNLSAGDLIPADALLLTSKNLHVQEAALTGESLPVEKEPQELSRAQTSESLLPGAQNALFLGTSVVSGTATALVTATGRRTVYGGIATRLIERAPETEFERGARRFGLLIARTVFFLVLFVLVVNLALRRDPLASFLFAVALAVGLTPEFLPMITTVTLGRGALRMARRKVIVKRLEAMQNFGSIDVLCSDKTGTLTSGEMKLDQHVDPLGASSEHVFLLAYLNSLHETGISSPLERAIKRRAQASPLDQAILLHENPNVREYVKLDEIPFDFERRRQSVVVVAREGVRLLVTKGAPESVIGACVEYEAAGRVVAFDAEARSRCEALYRDYSAKGLRTLAVAYRSVPEQPAYRVADENGLVLAGFLTFSDPPLESAAAALRTLRRDGVRVKILTGDGEEVARHVCAEVGLNVVRIVRGDELERMTDAALAHVVEQVDVFARASPGQKNRIILALKSRGHVVGYMGDGINDAPSLHAADVGISVSTAVEVAKEAASVILTERGLGVLHGGIIEGRRSFGNVMKYLLMGTSSNFGNMFSMAGAALFLPFLPMLPTQILLNNFLYDLAQVTIPFDRVDGAFVRQPHRWEMRLIRDFMLWIGPVSSAFDFLTFYVLLKIFHSSETLFHTGWFVESLATQTLVIFVIRTAGSPLRSRPSAALAATTLGVVLLGVALPYTPLAPLIGFAPLPAAFLLFLLLAIGTYLLCVELVKRRLMRRLI